MHVSRSVLLLGTVCSLAVVSSATAQEPWKRRVDLTLGFYGQQGGEAKSRSGVLMDVLVAGERNSQHRWAPTGGGGVGLYAVRSSFGATPDQCEVISGLKCRPQGGLTSLYAVGGVARSSGTRTVRTLLGPLFGHGLGSNSIGVQAQVDLNAMFASHAGIGAMLRGAVMPSHGGQNLSLWSGGVSLAFR